MTTADQTKTPSMWSRFGPEIVSSLVVVPCAFGFWLLGTALVADRVSPQADLENWMVASVFGGGVVAIGWGFGVCFTAGKRNGAKTAQR